MANDNAGMGAGSVTRNKVELRQLVVELRAEHDRIGATITAIEAMLLPPALPDRRRLAIFES